MTSKEKLLKILPKNYHNRVADLTKEEDLVDGCKYLVRWTNEYTDGEIRGGTFPVHSIKEAADFIKHSIYAN